MGCRGTCCALNRTMRLRRILRLTALQTALVLGAAFAALLSHAQRRLSTPVRLVRRRAREVTGTIELIDGSTIPITPETLTAESERALRAVSIATVCIALALVLLRVT